MPGIFDDERRETGPIWPNPEGTNALLLLNCVAKGLKEITLRRLSRLFRNKRAPAGATSYSSTRPRVGMA
jgi:hypothetical protein